MSAGWRSLLSNYRTQIDRDRIRHSSRRLAVWLLVAAATGAAVGLVVVGFQYIVFDLMWTDQVAGWPVWALAAAPGVGLAIAFVVLRLMRSGPPETAEGYIRAFHERRRSMPMRRVPGKLIAGIATVGLGGSMGLEGPSLFVGGSVGDSIQRRFARLFQREEAKILLVAGGAAGIAAVFKAPLTGLVFAMEVPYRDDIARHVLGPALVASASGYLVEAAIRGVDPLVPIVGIGGFELPDLAASIVLGLLAGLVGRAIIVAFRRVRAFLASFHPPARIILAAATLALVALACEALYGSPLALGPGEEAITAAAVGRLSLWGLVALLALKAIATSVTAGAGGVGGLFFPLVVMGTALGGAFSFVAPGAHESLLPLVGMASLLGAAYHTPLAGVSFVAEATGNVGFLIPTFVATAAAYATIGSASISGRQRFRRAGSVERMLDVPVAEVLSPEVVAVPADETIDGFFDHFALPHRHRTFPVVGPERDYIGTIDIELALEVPSLARGSTTVGEVAGDTVPVAEPTWTVRRALEVMSDAGTDVLPVLDPNGRLLGSVVTSEIFRLDAILARLRADERPGGAISA